MKVTLVILGLGLITNILPDSIYAESSKELWNELQVAKDTKTIDQLDLQAFQTDIQAVENQAESAKHNGFVEQTISTGLAGLKKEESPVKKQRARSSTTLPLIENEPRPNQTIFYKNEFKAPRQRSR